MAGLWLATIGILSSAAQLALVRVQGTASHFYSPVGVFLAPFCFSMGIWFAVVGKPSGPPGQPPFWYKAGFWVLMVATVAFSASIVTHPQRLLLAHW